MPSSTKAEELTIATLTLFELWSYGHTPNFMRLIIESWASHCTGCLRAIVTNRFLNHHRFVFEGFENAPSSSIRWVVLDEADEAALDTARANAERIRQTQKYQTESDSNGLLTLYWAMLEKYGNRFPSRHILLMNLDEYLFPLSAGLRAPAAFSGIFFRPDYYYGSEDNQATFRRRVFNAIQKRLLHRLLDHPQLRVAFFIDPLVADSLKDKGKAQAIYLEEPVRLPERHASSTERTAIRARLGVPADRQMFLLFGEISGRKGVWKLLDSIDELTSGEATRMCLAVVGRAEPIVEQQLAARLEAVVASTSLAIIRRAAYVDESELDDWFMAADVVLAPYTRHFGMSGILLLASAYRKPVISGRRGAMGRLTHKYRLGLTVNPGNRAELARAMGNFLRKTPPGGWKPEAAYAFAKGRSRDKFGEQLLGALRPFLG
jgi:glycosyltransferase involved in cell wall biosynthesis